VPINSGSSAAAGAAARGAGRIARTGLLLGATTNIAPLTNVIQHAFAAIGDGHGWRRGASLRRVRGDRERRRRRRNPYINQ